MPEGHALVGQVRGACLDVASLLAVSAADSAPVPAVPDRRLLDLQALDLSLARLRARREILEGGDDVRLARGRLTEVENRIGELKLSMDDVAGSQRRLEGDIDSMSQKADAERRRLFDGSVANARELQAIEAEVASLRTRISAKEDQLLEAMERGEELGAALSPLEAEMAEARDRLTEIQGSSAHELQDIERGLTEQTVEREQVAAAIDPGILELYEELRQLKKGVGAVELTDGVCQGCHQKLSPVYLDRLKRQEGAWRCEYCRRILIAS
jgi:predicted  nucleic acid-binding Zn-ribbon protein